jgi:hypothetical protein
MELLQSTYLGMASWHWHVGYLWFPSALDRKCRPLVPASTYAVLRYSSHYRDIAVTSSLWVAMVWARPDGFSTPATLMVKSTQHAVLKYATLSSEVLNTQSKSTQHSRSVLKYSTRSPKVRNAQPKSTHIQLSSFPAYILILTEMVTVTTLAEESIIHFDFDWVLNIWVINISISFRTFSVVFVSTCYLGWFQFMC